LYDCKKSSGSAAWVMRTSGSSPSFALVSGGTTLDISNTYTSGGYVVERVSNNESGVPDFSTTLTFYAGSNGATVRDNVWSSGYNRGPSGKQVSGKHAWYYNVESDYKTAGGVRQLEMYFGYESPSGTYAVRPFSITPHIDLDTVEVGIRAESIKVGYVDTTFDWLQFVSSSSTGQLSLTGNSSITYDASNRYFISSGGQGLLGYQSSVGYLFKGLSSATFFDLYAITDADLTINVGGNSVAGTRGLRWNSTSSAWQYQYNTQAGGNAWRNMYIPAPLTVSTLDTCNSNTKGARDTVTDANSPTLGATVSGSGSTIAQVWCDGSNWKVNALASTTPYGTVTSVGWTGGIVSVATGTTTPAFTIAGTSGGIPYFSSASTWASSGALAANTFVMGGGAGAAPTTGGGYGVTTAGSSGGTNYNEGTSTNLARADHQHTPAALTSVTPVTVNANSTSAQNLIVSTIPAGALNSVNRHVRIRAAGVYTTQSAQTPTVTIAAKLCTVSGCGSGTVITLATWTSAATTAAATNMPWNYDINLATISTGATGTVEAHGSSNITLTTTASGTTTTRNDTNTGASSAIDLTAQLFLQTTITFSTNAATANTCTQRMVAANFMN
jgi:hypothetical protein